MSDETSFSSRAIREFHNALTSGSIFGVPRYTTALLPTVTSNQGGIAYDTTSGSFKGCDGSTWAALGGSFTGGAITSSITTPADVGYGVGVNGGFISQQSAGTPDQSGFWTGTTSNAWIIAENADKAFDFAHAAATDPTLFIHSHNQSTTQWISLAHNGTDGIITTGTGAVWLKPVDVYLGTAPYFYANSNTGNAQIGNFQYVFTSSSSATSGSVDTGLGRLSAGVLKATNGTTSIRGLLGGGAAVASASALPVPTGRVFHVTGTTNITSITSTNFASGTIITIIFDGVLTFTDGNNLKLAGDFVTTADDTITLAYDGTNWYECSRSVN